MVLKVAGGGGGTSGAVNYLGTWNAASNNPTLTSGVGTKGGYYVVSTAGTTTLDGISLWSVGDWAVFNGTVWQKVDGSSNEAFNGITVTSLTGYMYANNTSPVTASTTIPVASVTGAVPNTVNVLASGLLSGGGALTGNVTIGLTSVPSGNVTGLGTMATQNANAVAITGGTINSTTLNSDTFTNANITSVAATFPNSYLANSSATLGNTTVTLGSTTSTVGNLTLGNVTVTSGNTSVTYDNAVYQIATSNITASSNVGAFSYGNLSYSDVGIVASFANSANNSTQVILQNSSSANNASSDYVAVNDTGSVYADFGVTSSTYVGIGNFYKSNSAYFYGGGSDVYIGSISNNAVHFVANNSTTDAMVVNANNTVTINAYSGTTNANATFNTSSLPLVPLGYLVLNINGTNYKIPYYNV